MITGVVDQYMYAAEFKLGFLEQICAGIHVRNIHRNSFDLGDWLKLLCHALEVFLAASHEYQVGASMRKLASGRRTYPFRSACDDDGFVLEIIVHRGSLDDAPGPEKNSRLKLLLQKKSNVCGQKKGPERSLDLFDSLTKS